MTAYTKLGSLYPADMPKPEIMNVQEFRRTFSTCAKRAVEEDTPTVITKFGKPDVALVSMEWFRRASEALGTPTDL